MGMSCVDADERGMEPPVVPAGTAGMEFFIEDDPVDILSGTHTGHFGMIATIPF
jgi:hypothetical protein